MTLEIMILKDPREKVTKEDTKKKELLAVEAFTGSGANMIAMSHIYESCKPFQKMSALESFRCTRCTLVTIFTRRIFFTTLESPRES